MTESPEIEQEGVIKYQCHHEYSPLKNHQPSVIAFNDLLPWRQLSWQLKLIGQDQALYEGYGYGNISIRHPEKGFLISGSQTSGVESPDIEDFCWVQSVVLAVNEVVSKGDVKPSSESMTHAAIYEALPQACAVLHAHNATIFKKADTLSLPATPSDIPYGTVAMAKAVQNLVTEMGNSGVFVMKGHQDGVVSYAESPEQAAALMIDILAKASLNE